MQAGRLDRRVTLLRAVETRDGFNAPVQDFVAFATVWGSKRDVSDAERLRAAEVAATITTRFQIRWSNQVKDVGPRDRLQCDGRAYDIVGVKEIQRRVGLEISAVARNEVRP